LNPGTSAHRIPNPKSGTIFFAVWIASAVDELFPFVPAKPMVVKYLDTSQRN